MATSVLITGASGLIGSRVMATLTDDALVVQSIEVIEPGIDLLSPGEVTRIVDQYRPDLLLHLAWVASSTANYRHHPDNRAWVAATTQLARRCLARGVLFIGTGTVAERQELATDEYVRAKRQIRAELDPEISAGTLGWLQPHYVFDPVIGTPEVVRVIRDALAGGRQPELRTPGSLHDFVLVDDVAAGIATVVRTQGTGLFPIGSGRLHSVAQVAVAMGAQDRFRPTRPPGTPTDGLVADITRLADLGWSPIRTEEYFRD